MISKNVFRARKLAGLTQQTLADKAGCSQQKIQQIESGVMGNPTKLDRIAKALGTNEASLRFAGLDPRDYGGAFVQGDQLCLMSSLSYAESAKWPKNSKSIDNWASWHGTMGNDWFTVWVEDDSMTCDGPLSMPQKTQVIIDPSTEIKTGDFGLFEIDGGEVVYRRYRKNGKKILLVALNETYSVIEPSEFRIIGKAEHALVRPISPEEP